MGSADTRDSRDRETETGEKLVASETQRRRGLWGNQGHQRDTLTKADLPRCKTLTLPSSRGLAGVNGGSAALRAVRRRAQPMPSRLRFTPSISEPRESDRNKNGVKWWSREAWLRRRCELGRNSGEEERLGARQCRLTHARQWPRR